MLTGTFNTQEVRPWNRPTPETSKSITFAEQFIAPPNIPIGLNFLDINRNASLRVNAHASDITRNNFNFHIDSSPDATLYAGGASWLGLPLGNPECQSGEFSTSEVHPSNKPQRQTSRRITFEHPFATPPKVTVFLNQLDMAKGKNWRVIANATDVDRTGFTIHIDTWADSVLNSARAGWIAHHADREDVFSGSSDTSEVRPWNRPQLKNSKTINFSGVKFSTPPSIFMAINSLDIDCRANLRLKTFADAVSTTSMTWHIDSWSDTVLFSAGVTYICAGPFTFAPPSPCPSSGNPPILALIIGINTYKSTKHSELCGAVQDAEDMRDYLLNDLGVPSSQIRMLCNENATRSAIITELLNLKSNSSINRNDPILIFFAGHGAETDAPADWGDLGRYTQMIIPHDEGTTAVNSHEKVYGIPDRTMGALLNHIASEKGDNIIVIYDCCYTASTVPVGRQKNSERVRSSTISKNIPGSLDEEIWRHQPQRPFSASETPNFKQNDGMWSYVIITACEMKECAWEGDGRGRFTATFLATIRDIGVDLVTYNEVIRRMPTIPQQTPQCEGYNRNRITELIKF